MSRRRFSSPESEMVGKRRSSSRRSVAVTGPSTPKTARAYGSESISLGFLPKLSLPRIVGDDYNIVARGTSRRRKLKLMPALLICRGAVKPAKRSLTETSPRPLAPNDG